MNNTLYGKLISNISESLWNTLKEEYHVLRTFDNVVDDIYNDRLGAVRVSAEVGLRNASHDVSDAERTRVNCSDAQEKQVASRHECVRERAFGLFLVHFYAGVSERAVCRDLAYEIDVHKLEADTSPFRDRLRYGCLMLMLLTVIEADCVNFLEFHFCPEQASGGVLSSAQNNKSLVVRFC